MAKIAGYEDCVGSKSNFEERLIVGIREPASHGPPRHRKTFGFETLQQETYLERIKSELRARQKLIVLREDPLIVRNLQLSHENGRENSCGSSVRRQ